MGRDLQEKTPDKSAPLLMIAAFFASLFMVIAGPDSPASAKEAANIPGILYWDNGTYIFTYDFQNKEDWGRGNVDWATSLMFYGNASINRVKDILDGNGYGQISTNSMHMPVKDSTNLAVWDDDAGKKGIACPLTGQETRHYRIYADPATDFLWTEALGGFVVATTHWDANECPNVNTRFYDSEEVEGHIGNTMSGLGYTVSHDFANFFNAEPYRVQGNSTWDNDGYATYIDVPV